MYSVLIIGAVQTTAVTLEKLIQYNFNIVGVLGNEPINVNRVSGWTNLKLLAENYGLDYLGFQKINNQSHIDWAAERKPDIIFAVGFSQLLKNVWLKMPKLGCIGFHPTKLPEGRGRAPLAWAVLENKTASATFFLMGEGADDGPIFIQSLFEVQKDDDATVVEEKIKEHIGKSLDVWLPELKKGIWNPEPQDDAMASWYGKRAPEDGWINWNNSSEYLNRLIKASSKPHPGAYTYYKDFKVVIWKSQLETSLKIKGVVGRVLLIEENKGYLIQCGQGLLWIRDIDTNSERKPRVGDKLGYNVEDEIYKIKNKAAL